MVVLFNLFVSSFCKIEIFVGISVMSEFVVDIDVDIVMLVIVGVVGLLFILSVVEVGKKVLFVNKEFLVMLG